jgi:asparagine synthase (glutamine-hydrolysing)
MCGIAGIFRTDGGVASAEDLTRLLEPQAHRGPDGEGGYACGHMAIGMKRLAIIDVAGGDQPIWNEDKSIAIVCNGEIYNYQVLAEELRSKGHRFRTKSDVEVILHLYEEYGERCFTKLNGMFAVAIADFQKSEMLLARDPFGQKPLYIWEQEGIVRYASELKCLASHAEFNRKISDAALVQLLAFRYVPAPLSIFENARKLPPGTSLHLTRAGKTTTRYWQIDLGANHQGPLHQGDDIRGHLTAAVERHLMSERPLGVFLSGGLDSSAIVSCMHALGHRQIHTYTVGFEGFGENEFDTARSVAKHFHTDHTEVVLKAEEFWDGLDTVLYFMDEPIADMTAYPVYRLSEQARQDVVVVLSGEGSDELLAGYQGCEELRKLFDRLQTYRRMAPLASLMLHLNPPASLERRLRTVLGSDADYLALNPTSMGRVFDDESRRKLCSGLPNGQSAMAGLSQYFNDRQGWHGLNLHLGGLIETWLPDELLHKADRITMAHSLELRCPFLDKDFAGYCANLSLDAKAKSHTGEAYRKIALKRAFNAQLPDGITYQQKKGFAIPVYAWLGSHFSENATRELRRASGFGTSLFTFSALETLMTEARAGNLLSQRRIWSIIALNKWAEHWL